MVTMGEIFVPPNRSVEIFDSYRGPEPVVPIMSSIYGFINVTMSYKLYSHQFYQPRNFTENYPLPFNLSKFSGQLLNEGGFSVPPYILFNQQSLTIEYTPPQLYVRKENTFTNINLEIHYPWYSIFVFLENGTMWQSLNQLPCMYWNHQPAFCRMNDSWCKLIPASVTRSRISSLLTFLQLQDLRLV